MKYKQKAINLKTRLYIILYVFIFTIIYCSIGVELFIGNIVGKNNSRIVSTAVGAVMCGAGSYLIIIIMRIYNNAKRVVCAKCKKINKANIQRCLNCGEEITGFEKVVLDKK